MSEKKHTPGTGVHPEDMNALTEYWHWETNYINDKVDSAFKSAQDDAYARGYRRGREDLIAIRAQRDSFKDAAEYNKRRAEDAERQRDELLSDVDRCYRMLLSEPDTKGALFKAENILREAIAAVKGGAA